MAFKETDPTDIPIVDIAPLRNGSDPIGVGKALHRASSSLGFIYIANHGISDAVIKTAHRTASEFFRHDETDKMTIAINDSHRGFIGRGGAKMGDDLQADLKESFIWGYEETDGMPLNDHPLRGQNQWPVFMPSLDRISSRWNVCEREFPLSIRKSKVRVRCNVDNCAHPSMPGITPDSDEPWLVKRLNEHCSWLRHG